MFVPRADDSPARLPGCLRMMLAYANAWCMRGLKCMPEDMPLFPNMHACHAPNHGCIFSQHAPPTSAAVVAVVSLTASCTLRCMAAGDFLQPDEVTFTVLLRGYGALDPPDWVKIDTTLTTMRMKYGIQPTASELGPGSPPHTGHAARNMRAPRYRSLCTACALAGLRA